MTRKSRLSSTTLQNNDRLHAVPESLSARPRDCTEADNLYSGKPHGASQVHDLSGMAINSCLKPVPEDEVHSVKASLKAGLQRLGNRAANMWKGGRKGTKAVSGSAAYASSLPREGSPNHPHSPVNSPKELALIDPELWQLLINNGRLYEGGVWIIFLPDSTAKDPNEQMRLDLHTPDVCRDAQPPIYMTCRRAQIVSEHFLRIVQAYMYNQVPRQGIKFVPGQESTPGCGNLTAVFEHLKSRDLEVLVEGVRKDIPPPGRTPASMQVWPRVPGRTTSPQLFKYPMFDRNKPDNKK
ncbi:hypothetical protein WJX82_001449 [Trebouxia sp. C0006]